MSSIPAGGDHQLMSKRFGHTIYRGQVVSNSPSGYFIQVRSERPLTLLEFPSFELAKHYIDGEIEKQRSERLQLRQSITKVVNDPDLLKGLAARDEKLAKKLLTVARECGLLKEAAA
jgi:hypothetical protein